MKGKRLRGSPEALFLGAVLLVSWELFARWGVLPSAFLSSPSQVVGALWQGLVEGALLREVGVTLGRMSVALAWGGALGVGWGLAMGLSARLRRTFDPFVAALHPIPRMALLPVILLLFGLGFLSKAMVVAIAVFFPVVLNTMAGIRGIDPQFLEVARVFGLRGLRFFRMVVFPASLPMILVGLRLGLIRALGATISLELIVAQDGLGSLLFLAWQTYRSEDLYATVVVIALLGIGARGLVDALGRRFVPWSLSR